MPLYQVSSTKYKKMSMALLTGNDLYSLDKIKSKFINYVKRFKTWNPQNLY